MNRVLKAAAADIYDLSRKNDRTLNDIIEMEMLAEVVIRLMKYEETVLEYCQTALNAGRDGITMRENDDTC